jgi:recombination DNA repair RAD52 pathway protein
MAKVRIAVRASNLMVVREGTGYGSGISPRLGDAYESAIKEAESDAMKRALMTFGNKFGLALYDKDQTNVGASEDTVKAIMERLSNSIMAAKSLDALAEIWKANASDAKHTLPDNMMNELVRLKDEKKAELSKEN